MKITIREYDLPDLELISSSNHTYKFIIWEPERIYIILGRSNKPEISLFLENVYNDQIPVVKRPSGGESVIISPCTMIISAVHRTTDQKPSREYFKLYNALIIEALEELNIRGLEQNGISDITLNGRKIAGSSIYRNKNFVFFHAVLNVSESTDLMEKYLCFPRRFPGYRKGRSHAEFVTSLRKEEYTVNTGELKKALASKFLAPI